MNKKKERIIHKSVEIQKKEEEALNDRRFWSFFYLEKNVKLS